MKLSYPSPAIAPFSDSVLLALRIARHTPCSACNTCQGLRPPPGVELVLGDDTCHRSSLGDLNQYGSDEDDEPTCLETCVCGHDVVDHGADEAALGPEEFSRRARLAVHLDKLLQVRGPFRAAREAMLTIRLRSASIDLVHCVLGAYKITGSRQTFGF